MNKHTPGPWHWEFTEGPLDPPQLEGNVEYSDQNPILVTRGCSPSCMREYGRPCPLVPSKEDMALIAAAPQLLEALKQIDAESQGGFRRPVEEMIAIARAAIAAAEGKI